ncbi:MAG: hypothetical protein ABJZ55_00980 [Fuerstiella sp.]
MFRFQWVLVLACFLPNVLLAQGTGQKMPRENVVDVPAIHDGLCVSNVFQSNMVLQRDKPVVIWGWANPGEELVITLDGQEVMVKATDDRSWRATLPAMKANSNAQSLKIQGANESLKLSNILIGDVWVLGGQSNMEFPLDRIENGQLEIVSANYPSIRIMTVPQGSGQDLKSNFERLHEWSGWFGQHYRKGDWDECTPEIARELSAIGYVFGRRIHMASQVPIGIIDVSRGGTSVETWTPIPVLRKMESDHVKALLTDWDQKVAAWDAQADLALRIANFKAKAARLKKEGRVLPANETEPSDLKPGPPLDMNRPGNCYAGMIGPLVGLQVKGAIFHQGYNNCFSGTPGTLLYRDVFPEMIAAWRTAFGDPEMPFGIISLCTEGTSQTLNNYCEMMANPGPFIREAQYQTFVDLYKQGQGNVGFTSTYDMRRRWYHPQLKIPAGERMARWALATEYGFERSIRWKPPMVQEMKVVEDRIELRLDEPASAVDNGGPILGFAVAGEDRKFHPATAEHLVTGKDNRGRDQKDKTVIVLSSSMVPAPVHYRYAWGRSPLGNLQAERNSDIPFATQRSDNWSLESVPSGVFDEEIAIKLDRKQQQQQLKALRSQDIQRQLSEAAALKAAGSN